MKSPELQSDVLREEDSDEAPQRKLSQLVEEATVSKKRVLLSKLGMLLGGLTGGIAGVAGGPPGVIAGTLIGATPGFLFLTKSMDKRQSVEEQIQNRVRDVLKQADESGGTTSEKAKEGTTGVQAELRTKIQDRLRL